jgi:hypothetical protein
MVRSHEAAGRADATLSVTSAQRPLGLRARLAADFDTMVLAAKGSPELAERLPFAGLLSQFSTDNLTGIANLFSAKLEKTTSGIQYAHTIAVPALNRQIIFHSIDGVNGGNPYTVVVANPDGRGAEREYFNFFENDKNVSVVLGDESLTIVQRFSTIKDRYEMVTMSPSAIQHIEGVTEAELLRDEQHNRDIAKAIALLD